MLNLRLATAARAVQAEIDHCEWLVHRAEWDDGHKEWLIGRLACLQSLYNDLCAGSFGDYDKARQSFPALPAV